MALRHRARERRRRHRAELRLDAGRGRHRDRKPAVLGEQRRVRARRGVAGERARHAVAADPALPARALDDGERSCRIEADALGQRERLGGAGEVDRGEQVVDELGAGAVAGALAEPEHRFRQFAEQRGVPGVDRIAAGDHQAHRSSTRTGRAARHRRLDPVDAERVEARRERLDALGRDRRTEDDAGARRRRARDAIAAEQHRLGLRRIDHRDDHHRAGLGERRRRRADLRADVLRERFAVGANVADGDRVAAVAQALGHRQAHVADADDARAARFHRRNCDGAAFSRADDAAHAAASAARARRGCRSSSSRCRRGRAASAPRAGRRRG